MVGDKEPLVDDSRIERAWTQILLRLPQLEHAVPDAWIQPATKKEPAKAVFAVAEPNPRHFNHMQVSAVHMDLRGWTEKQKEIEHYVSNGFDPLVWCLFQAAAGHLQVMDNIRQMSHPVVRIDEKGQRVETFPTGG